MDSIDLKRHSGTQDGREKILEWMNSQTRNILLEKRDLQCWQLYNNTSDDKEFEYLTKIGQYELPSKLRRIPVQRAKANVLISQQSLRPIRQTSSIIDEEGKHEAMHRVFQTIVGMAVQRHLTQSELIKAQLRELEQRKEQVQGQLQQLQSIEQPDESIQAQIQQILQFLPQFETEYNITKQSMELQLKMSDKEKEKVITYLESDYKDTEEIIADKLLNKYIKQLDIQEKSLEGLINKVVTGRNFYLVDYKPGDDLPTIETLNSQNVIYPSIESIKWAQDLPWVIVEQYMTKEQIRKSFNLSTKELNALDAIDENYYDSYRQGTFIAAPGDKAVDVSSGTHNQYKYHATGIKVKKVWWRTDHEVKAVKSPNKHNDELPFYNVVNEKEIINLKDYYYRKETQDYVNKKNPKNIKPKSSVYIYNSTKGQYPVKRYYDKRYKGIIIGNHIFHAEEDPIQPRMMDDFKTIPLPVVGRTYNGVGESPYSLIWATNELQKEYWVVNYHKELTFALAGASGVVFDLSQKPDGMNKDEWFYHMKLGRYLIQTISKTGQKKNTGYNQFSRVDQTLPQSIQYFDSILEGLDYQIGMIMGVPRQRLGEVQPSDQVGTFQMANEQAALTTEILYHEHDVVLNKALTLLINIATQYVVKPGEVIGLEGDVLEFINIPLNFGARRFSVKLETTVKKERDLIEMKRIALQLAQQGQIGTEFIFELFTTDSLKELKAKVEAQVKKQQELILATQQQGQEAELQAQQKAQQLQMQFEEQMKMIDAKLTEAGIKMQAIQGEQDFILGNRKLDIEQSKVAGDQQIGAAQTIEQGRKNVNDEKLRLMELQLEAALKSTGVGRGIDVKRQ